MRLDCRLVGLAEFNAVSDSDVFRNYLGLLVRR
jgi:hypothetical protein